MAETVVEFHDSTNAKSPVHVIRDADIVLIAHDDPQRTVTCLKERSGVTYKRRARNQIPDGHRFAVEDAEAEK